jgi:hypothetical protein
MFHCPYCRKFVQAIKKAATVSVIVCGACGSLLNHSDDLPHRSHSSMQIATVTTTVSGSGGSATLLTPFTPNDTSQSVMAHWRRQLENHHRVAIDSAAEMMRRNPNLYS